jgi:AcrR family transcriptional regulator
VSSGVQKQTRPKNRGDGEATRLLILDEAERLFARDGFSGVSVRRITTAAKVDAALISYHFGSKENLFREVLVRRVEKMSAERKARLERVTLIARDSDSLAQVLEAFIAPFIGANEEEINNLKNYRRLVALVANSKTWQGFVFKEHYDETAIDFIKSISFILPDVVEKDLYWAFSSFLGSLVIAFSETERIDNLSGGLCQSSDLHEAQRQIIQYSVGGFMGLPRQEEKA